MRSLRPITAARRLAAASIVTFTLAAGLAAGVPAALAGVPGCAWQPLSLINGWQGEQSAWGTGDPAFCASSDGMIYLSGSLAGGTLDQFATLPSYDWPAHTTYLSAYTFGGVPGVVRIDTDGAIFAYEGNSTQFTSLAGLSYASASMAQTAITPLINGWQSANSAYQTGDPSYAVSSSVAHLSGSVLYPNGSPWQTSWNFANLPAAIRPTGCFTTDVYTYAGGTGNITVDHQGNISGANPQYASLAGVSYPVGNVPWQPLTLANGYGNFSLAGCNNASYYIDAGVIYLTGFIEFSGSFSGELGVLPPGARPAHTLYLVVYGGAANAEYVTLEIEPNGEMYVSGAGGSVPCIQLDGLSYHTGS